MGIANILIVIAIMPEGEYMKKQHPIIKGTIILTLTGLLSRVIGFFYRIFLSYTIGAEGMGIYQLIFPVYALCYSLTVAGIETVISRIVAAKLTLGDKKAAKDTLIAGLILSVGLSMVVSLLIYQNAEPIAVSILGEPRCASLLEVMALCTPFGAIHSCISGYYYGLKKAGVPAAAQLVEQVLRVGGVYLIYHICISKGIAITPSIAVYGLVLGEFASMLFTATAVSTTFTKNHSKRDARGKALVKKSSSLYPYMRELIVLSFPLTVNRVCINLLQGAETILIPGRLRLFGLSTGKALSMYGVLTGMALPLILFPSAITNSVSLMLLPTVAEAQAKGRNDSIREMIETTIKYSMILGILCTGGFLTYGEQIGRLLFNNEMSGSFIMTLAWICPFLYLSTTLNSILHGLGKMTTSSINNLIGLGIRILFVLFFIPKYGITGYLWGLLTSELAITVLSIFVLNRYTKLTYPLDNWVLKPVFSLMAALSCASVTSRLLKGLSLSSGLIGMLLSGLVMCAVYLLGLFATQAIHIHHKNVISTLDN